MKKEHLHLLIDEEIYLISSEEAIAKNDEVEAADEVPAEEPKAADEEVEESKKEVAEEPTSHEPPKPEETPSIPTTPSSEVETKIKFAFFHNTDNSQELDLLNKIIAACKLDSNHFKVLKVGQEATFEKAVVFTKSGPSYYTSTQHERGVVMYSQPLALLMTSKEEKGKLWSALQEFVK